MPVMKLQHNTDARRRHHRERRISPRKVAGISQPRAESMYLCLITCSLRLFLRAEAGLREASNLWRWRFGTGLRYVDDRLTSQRGKRQVGLVLRIDSVRKDPRGIVAVKSDMAMRQPPGRLPQSGTFKNCSISSTVFLRGSTVHRVSAAAIGESILSAFGRSILALHQLVKETIRS